MRKGIIGVAALAICMIVASVGARAQTKLVVQAGSGAPSAVYIPVYIAQQLGFFKDEGLDVELRYLNGSAVATQLIANGDADVGHVVFDPMILGYSQGIRGKFFYQTYTHLMYFVASLADGPIKTAADLKDKKIGVLNTGSPGLYVARSLAEQAGVPENSMTFIPVGIGPQALAALTSKRVDAFGLWDAVYASYEAAGEKLNYIYHPTLKDNGNGGFFASDKVLTEKHKALEGFVRAIAKATVVLKANPEAAVRMYWVANPSAKSGSTDAEAMRRSKIELNFVSQAFDVSRRPGQKFGALDVGQVQALIDFLVQQKVLDKPIPAEAIITQDFVPAANDFDVEKTKAAAMALK